MDRLIEIAGVECRSWRIGALFQLLILSGTLLQVCGEGRGAGNLEGASLSDQKPEKRLSSTRLRRERIRHLIGQRPHKALANWIFVSKVPGFDLAGVVACGGDFNGDGFSDVAIGEPKFDEGRGRMLIFLGSAGGLGSDHLLVIEGHERGREFGGSVSFLGDVNGDGCDDLLIGGEGLFWGDRNSPLRESSNSKLSSGIAIGDINGDHFDDVVVRTDPKPNEEVELQIYAGSPTGLKDAPSWVLQSEQAGSHFAHDVATAGDVNGDGFDDLVVGAMKFSGRFKDGGKAYLYFGSQNGLSKKPNWTAEYPLEPEAGVDEEKEQFFTFGLSGACDVNGDGFDDVIIGASFAERRDRNEGIVFVYHGSASGLSKSPDWTSESNHPHALFGQSVSSAFDVNGDGFDDIIVGAPQAMDGQQEEGAALLFYGSPKGLSGLPKWTMES
ncbi:MAG: FG-GAP-like repeat-containing protein, partial [Nitrospira sp.]|nr:FG-GAP-like repeat-containing protein [Nitrospira sp.]